jgi:hypothetical protein
MRMGHLRAPVALELRIESSTPIGQETHDIYGQSRLQKEGKIPEYSGNPKSFTNSAENFIG